MKVSLDIQPCMGNKSGIGIFTHEMVSRLKDDGQVTFQGTLFNFLNRHEDAHIKSEYRFPIKISNVIPFGVLRRLWQIPFVNYSSLFPKADVYQFFGYIVPPRLKGKVITTIYDLTYLRYPETMSAKNLEYLKKEMKRTIESSDVILTISDYIKQEMIEELGIPESKIRRIYLAASLSGDEMPYAEVSEKYSIKKKPYILSVSTIEPRKNYVRLIQAYNQLRDETNQDIQLILAGGKGWNNETIYEEAENSLYREDIIFTGYITEEEKTTLYKNASLFVFPSLYEGFGIPLLEAMELGVPIVTSNAASMPEVVGEAAELVNPLEVDSITKGMRRVLTDDNYRQELIQFGSQRCKEFTWEKSVEQLLQVYKELQNEI